MTFPHTLSEHINLYVAGRISAEDAARQTATASEILRRLAEQPGLVLADEVGMGKTFVALAVAVSVALGDEGGRPVVVMVPPSLREKWPADFEVFREKCLPPHLAERLRFGMAERAIDFLKFLDDPPERGKAMLFVTHGAMSRGISDGWVKLALIRRAMLWRRNPDLQNALCRYMGKLLQMQWVERLSPAIWQELLSTPPKNWLDLLDRQGIDPEGDGYRNTNDDPVPAAVVEILDRLNLDKLYATLDAEMPRRRGQNIAARVKRARQRINEELREVWKECLAQWRLRLPLLILDEAHHLKNSQTRLASLFHVSEAAEDADEVTRGALGGAFERMLFLTATPFQLGHHELCSVLERFHGIAWSGGAQPAMDRDQFSRKLEELRRSLDRAQEAALHLDECWGRLRQVDLVLNGAACENVDAWWSGVFDNHSEATHIRHVLDAYCRARERLKEAEELLRPWVVRHLKARVLPEPHGGVARRKRLPGCMIMDENTSQTGGISVDGQSLLPFLLAARATACTPESRPVFAEGLASSYEAFLHTRQRNLSKTTDESPTDSDDDAVPSSDFSDEARWYLDRLYSHLPLSDPAFAASHPKVSATVSRAVAIWRCGEKVVVFCHYVATGRALRQRISQAIEREMNWMAAERLGCGPEQAADELERLGARFFDTDSPIREACDAEVRAELARFSSLQKHATELIEIVRRNLRTPSFLVRYFPIERGTLDRLAASEAFEHTDASGLTLRQLLSGFFQFLDERCGEADRERYVQAMKAVQTGTHRGADASRTYSPDELQDDASQMLLPNVRLVNGATRQETRQRLMLTFNTPFYPDVLVASSVLAEGVDLHLCCRHIIHHDLCWNPSTLEQRTGRIDRIGAKVEQCGQPIKIFLPFVGETQDEKMYRVVMDRDRWFSIVMGEKLQLDARTTDKLAERVPIPQAIADELRFALEVARSPACAAIPAPRLASESAL